MANKPIVFAMANPDPEILPEEINDIAAVVATGRSDYPNQINNVLAFPGIFRGAFDASATDITEGMKIAAASAIAAAVSSDDLAPNCSIVRGTTTRAIVEMLRSAGAAEVHLRISSPPYRWPCFYGMDTGTKAELLAANLTMDEILFFRNKSVI